jgi:transposase
MPNKHREEIKRKPWLDPKPLPSVIRTIGRPSLYRPEYCDDLVAFCSKGYSIGAWAGRRGIARSTVQVWAAHHEEFSVAVEMAKGAKQADWEDKLLAARDDRKTTGPQATLIVFGLKNMGTIDWRGEPEQTPQPSEQHKHIHLHMSPTEAADAYQRFLRES